MGADAAVNVSRESLPEIMHKQGLVEGFDIGLEMSGNGAALAQMFSVMRNGGKISLLGISNQPVPIDMNQIITKGLTLQGIYGRKMDNWHQMSYMVQGGLDLTPVITTPQRSRIDTTAASRVVNLCANNYLGLSARQELIDAAKASYDQWGSRHLRRRFKDAGAADRLHRAAGQGA